MTTKQQNFIFTSGSANPLSIEAQDRRYRVVPSAIERNSGMFKEFTLRMARKTKEAIIRSFMDEGCYFSPSGTTGRLVVQHCLQQGYPFSVEYVVEPTPCYIIRLTGAEQMSKVLPEQIND